MTRSSNPNRVRSWRDTLVSGLVLGAGAIVLAAGIATSAVGGVQDLEKLRASAEAGDHRAQRQYAEILLGGERVTHQEHKRAIGMLEQAAAGGDAHAHYLLAWYAQYGEIGKGETRDRERIIAHYRQAAALGHTTAQVQYARLMFEYAERSRLSGATLAMYEREAVRLIENAANAGNSLALLDLAELKWHGRHLTRDRDAAVALYRRAAARQEHAAAWALAQILLDPRSRYHDQDEAIALLEQAAKGKIAPAALELAHRYEHGRGVELDLERARAFAQQSVTLGLQGAAHDVQRIDAALAKLRHAAELAQVQADAELARTNAEQLSREKRAADEKLAAVEQERSASRSALEERQADLDAQSDQLTQLTLDLAAERASATTLRDELAALRTEHELAKSRADAAEAAGVEARRELEEARAQLAALRSERDAALARADSVSRDRPSMAPVSEPKSAASSAPASEPVVPVAIAVADVRPLEVESAPRDPREINAQGLAAVRAGNPEEAVALFDTAARAGYPVAMNNLGLMLLRGTGASADPDRAAALFEQAVAKGNGAAANNLGTMFHRGLGVAVDFDRAEQWYLKAIALGNRSALTQLTALRSERLIAQR